MITFNYIFSKRKYIAVGRVQGKPENTIRIFIFVRKAERNTK